MVLVKVTSTWLWEFVDLSVFCHLSGVRVIRAETYKNDAQAALTINYSGKHWDIPKVANVNLRSMAWVCPGASSFPKEDIPKPPNLRGIQEGF